MVIGVRSLSSFAVCTIVAMSTAALSHRKLASAGIPTIAALLRDTVKGTLCALILTVKPGLNRSLLIVEHVFVMTKQSESFS